MSTDGFENVPIFSMSGNEKKKRKKIKRAASIYNPFAFERENVLNSIIKMQFNYVANLTKLKNGSCLQ